MTFNIDNVVIREHLSATYEATDFGTVTVSNSAPLYGDEVTYSVTPNEGYTFKGWQNANGDIVSTSATYTFKITANTVLTPVFNEVTLYNCAAISADENMGTAAVDNSKVYGSLPRYSQPPQMTDMSFRHGLMKAALWFQHLTLTEWL